MTNLTSPKDEDLVVRAAGIVLDKYGADRNLSDLVRSGETTTVFCVFCGRLVNHLRPLTTLSQTKRLTSFHQLSVTVLEDVWKKLFTDLRVAPVAALTRQSVNRHLFNILQVEATSTTSSGQCDSTPVVMGSEEENAVRYASGYVAMKLMKEFTKKDTERAAQFVECLSHMAVEGEESSFYAYTAEWVKSVDRGGLFQINTSSFLFFRAVEVATQAILPSHLCNRHSSTDSLLEKIIENEDVRFYWSMVSVDILDEAAVTELLQSIVTLWVRIRGFSITSAWLEQYKNATQTSTKAQKGLRKQLGKSKSKEQ